MVTQSHKIPKEYEKNFKQRWGYQEKLEEKFKEEDVSEKAERLRKLKESEVWKRDLEPELVRLLVSLEAQFCSTKDPHQRYGLVEAYNVLKNFKLWLDETSELT